MKKILILEDTKERQDKFKQNFSNAELVFVETAQDAIQKLSTNTWDALFLDHDLGEEKNGTGFDVAMFLHINKHLKPVYVILHSVNETGRKNMAALISAQEIPFVWDIKIDFDKAMNN